MEPEAEGNSCGCTAALRCDAGCRRHPRARVYKPRHRGVVLFISYDFFDNDPDQFASMKLYASDLPALLVVQDRGGFF